MCMVQVAYHRENFFFSLLNVPIFSSTDYLQGDLWKFYCFKCIGGQFVKFQYTGTKTRKGFLFLTLWLLLGSLLELPVQSLRYLLGRFPDFLVTFNYQDSIHFKCWLKCTFKSHFSSSPKVKLSEWMGLCSALSFSFGIFDPVNRKTQSISGIALGLLLSSPQLFWC